MKMLKEYITQAEQEKVAIGHFNFATLDGLWAIFNAMKALSMEIEHPSGPNGCSISIDSAFIALKIAHNPSNVAKLKCPIATFSCSACVIYSFSIFIYR